MDSARIRESYLTFFESKGARRVPSSSLVPEDPSLLLTTAGMVQFKPLFLGVERRDYTRATTCQKCVRTTDIDIIGTTGRHHSFFEMLGNFSFGDYFKEEACAWAYEYSVDVLGMDPKRLWYSIFEDDEETERIWVDQVGVPAERVVKLGAKDNFWAAGPTGPCGPCSELYYDQGDDVGCGSPDCRPGCDCDRFLEYWNLVFMQYERAEDGTLSDLPERNIDTGMGLERLAAILQGVPSNFETDILRSVMAVAEEVTSTSYGGGEPADTSLRILADHARAVTFMIADGILPSNEGRGYVLRRLLRRAVRHGRVLGVTESFLVALVDRTVETMGAAYPEIVEHHELARRAVLAEEERFGATLKQGLTFLEEAIEKASGSSAFDGRTAFMLHDTYGFPYELTAEIVAEAGMTVDQESFDEAMEEQRERARSQVKDESWVVDDQAFKEMAGRMGVTEFVGYASDEADAGIVGIIADGAAVERLEPGVAAEVMLDATPFYAEQGGQVGDTGVIGGDGTVFRVTGTRFAAPGLVAHEGELEEGALSVGDRVHASIDRMRRERIRRNHTATHLLHWALRLVLGEHVKQSGSYVAPDRLRFDFTHFEALGAEALDRIERMVNAKLFEDHPVRAFETSLASAREAGVTALFGEKYGEVVRVLEVGNFSKELCGGTHVTRTTEIGLLKIVSEGSVGSNLRRIEAVTSFDAYERVAADEAELREAAASMKVPVRDVAEKTAALVKRVRELESGAGRAAAAPTGVDVEKLAATAADVGYSLVVARVPDTGATGLRAVWDDLRQRLGGEGAAVFATCDPGSGAPLLMAAGSPAAVAAGFDAGSVIRHIAPQVGGGGGGKPSMAQAGGKDASGVDAAVDAAREMLGASNG